MHGLGMLNGVFKLVNFPRQCREALLDLKGIVAVLAYALSEGEYS